MPVAGQMNPGRSRRADGNGNGNGVAMEDAEAELRRRRDRAKESQRAFRQRQSNSAQKLKHDHEQLKRLVGEIVDAARVHDPAQLSVAITKAAKAVGLDTTCLTPSDTPTDTPFPEGPMNTNLGVDWQITDSPGAVASENIIHKPQNWSPLSSLDSEAALVQQTQTQTRSGRMSPRFDYGVWIDPDRFLKNFEPPIDIAPYLGRGEYTIAGHIAWACLDLGYTYLQDIMEQRALTPIFNTTTASLTPEQDSEADYPRSLPPNSGARRLFDLALRHSMPLHDLDYIIAMVEARIEFRRLGYMRRDNPGADAVKRELLQGRVFEDHRKRGVRMDQWWSAMDIERYIERTMGVYEFASFQAALRARQEAHTNLLMPLAHSLAQRAICFGDGPRWRADHVAMFARTWISMVRNNKETRC
ncbi:hypothetical protein A1O1_04808 [Capronia coronata CBS 617.96]|uniref:BZIP domain-containing protein n=1 Tax=Capronia coronata CBS 617.96 TaxID=1182541 RepID=W9YF72_9EURO|nr:uncharacterized protein A1O1_04808 [Capronia coronata CBS 617.96]EXJ87881.1 hypothetical protein A1O1_04808 [Capronia coronata CBS 617.96]